VNDAHDLRRKVDDAVYSYRLTTKGKVSFERWWKSFEASGVRPQFGLKVTKTDGIYYVRCSSLKLPLSKVPVIQSLAFQIAENGSVGPVQVQRLYPKSVPSGDDSGNGAARSANLIAAGARGLR
jgi:hypothetical protein